MNKLVYQYHNTYHHSINENPINVDYSVFTEKIETNHNAPKFIESELLIIILFLEKITLKFGQEKYLLLILF